MSYLNILIVSSFIFTQSEHVINGRDLNNVTDDHFIYIKYGTLDPKTSQPRFDVVYILDSNCGPTKASPMMSPYEPRMKNVSPHTNVPARRNLVFENESIKQLKKQKMIASSKPTVEEIVGDAPGIIMDPTQK